MAWVARSSLLSPKEEPADNTDPVPSASPGSSPRAASPRTFLSSPAPSPTASRVLDSFLAPAVQGGAPRRPDPAEIAGHFRARLPRLPGLQVDVPDLAKIVSSLQPLELDEAEAAAGLTVEVVAFARNAVLRPELWLNFPLLPDSDDFDMTYAQQDQVLAVESLALELAELRSSFAPAT